jgi:hypothetical protein
MIRVYWILTLVLMMVAVGGVLILRWLDFLGRGGER